MFQALRVVMGRRRRRDEADSPLQGALGVFMVYARVQALAVSRVCVIAEADIPWL